MSWLALIVVLTLPAFSAWFRKAALVALCATVIVGLGMYAYVKWDEQVRKDRQRTLESKVSSAQFSLTDGRFSRESYGYRFNGRVKNSSAFSVSDFDLGIKIYDCPQPNAIGKDNCESGRLSEIQACLSAIKEQQCTVIAETVEKLYLKVPAGQARDFDRLITFGGTDPSPKGEWRPTVNVVRIAAEAD